jgi:hypothetical protein
MLSDDRTAQSVIQTRTSLFVLRVHEVLALSALKGVASEAEAEHAFDSINQIQKNPVTIPVSELFYRAKSRFASMVPGGEKPRAGHRGNLQADKQGTSR